MASHSATIVSPAAAGGPARRPARPLRPACAPAPREPACHRPAAHVIDVSARRAAPPAAPPRAVAQIDHHRLDQPVRRRALADLRLDHCGPCTVAGRASAPRLFSLGARHLLAGFLDAFQILRHQPHRSPVVELHVQGRVQPEAPVRVARPPRGVIASRALTSAVGRRNRRCLLLWGLAPTAKRAAGAGTASVSRCAGACYVGRAEAGPAVLATRPRPAARPGERHGLDRWRRLVLLLRRPCSTASWRSASGSTSTPPTRPGSKVTADRPFSCSTTWSVARRPRQAEQTLEWPRVGTDRDGLPFNGTPGAIVDAQVMLTADAAHGPLLGPPAATIPTVRSSANRRRCRDRVRAPARPRPALSPRRRDDRAVVLERQLLGCCPDPGGARG